MPKTLTARFSQAGSSRHKHMSRQVLTVGPVEDRRGLPREVQDSIQFSTCVATGGYPLHLLNRLLVHFRVFASLVRL